MKQKQQKKWTSYFQLPNRNVNKDEPFYFKVYNLKTDGTIFILTALLIPLIALFIFRFALNMGTSNPIIKMNDQDASPLIFLVITLVSNIFGFYIFWQRDKEVFISSGFIVFYEFIFIQNVVALIVGMIIGFANIDSEKSTGALILLISQILAELLTIWLALKYTSGLFNRIKQTIKENFIMLLIVVLIVGGLMFFVSGFLYSEIFKNVPAMTEESNNQKNLIDSLKNGSVGFKVSYAIFLFILTVMVAPLTEEIATRNAIFVGVGNKWVAIIVASLYFGMIHVQAGDVEHILNYIIGGLFLSGIFAISRGNVTYDTGSHMIYNLINFIIILVTIFGDKK